MNSTPRGYSVSGASITHATEDDTKPHAIKVESCSTSVERQRKDKIYPVLVAGDFVFVAGLPPFDPVSGEVTRRPFEQPADLVLGQMKRYLEAVGSSMEQVVKCSIYCTAPAYYGAFNEAYVRYFPDQSPARIFPCVPCFFGSFDVEADCIAVVRSPEVWRDAAARACWVSWL